MLAIWHWQQDTDGVHKYCLCESCEHIQSLLRYRFQLEQCRQLTNKDKCKALLIEQATSRLSTRLETVLAASKQDGALSEFAL